MSLLPPLEGKYVVELGAGIGRFTGELAKEAGRVLAIDFIESVIRKVSSYQSVYYEILTFLFIYESCLDTKGKKKSAE